MVQKTSLIYKEILIDKSTNKKGLDSYYFSLGNKKYGVSEFSPFPLNFPSEGEENKKAVLDKVKEIIDNYGSKN